MNGGMAAKPRSTRNWFRTASLCLLLFVISYANQHTIRDHPRPVLPDESEFISALGFPSPYPVHSPGYPLWVALGTLARSAGFTPYGAYQVWSFAACAAGPMLLFLLLRRADPDTAYLTSLAFSVNPLWWFHGATALNYSLATVSAMVIFSLAWQALCRRNSRRAIGAAMILALAMGLRFDLLIWCGPALLYVASVCGKVEESGHRRSFAPTLIATAAILVIGAFAWVVVSRRLYSVAGAPSLSHTLSVLRSTSVLERGLVNGLARNAVKLAVYLAWGFGLATLLLLWALPRFAFHLRHSKREIRFLFIAFTPLLVFQLLIHITEAGHALWYLPAAYAVLFHAIVLQPFRRTGKVILVAITMSSVLQFLYYPWSADASGWRRTLNAKVAYISRKGLMNIDQRARIHQPNDFWTVPP